MNQKLCSFSLVVFFRTTVSDYTEDNFMSSLISFFNTYFYKFHNHFSFKRKKSPIIHQSYRGFCKFFFHFIQFCLIIASSIAIFFLLQQLVTTLLFVQKYIFLPFHQIFSICQSMGSIPFACRNSFAILKCLHPKNPL